MKKTFVQKVAIWLVERLISAIWVFDLATGYPLNQSLRFASRPYVLVSMILISVLTYFIYVPFVSDVFKTQYKNRDITNYVASPNEAPTVLGAGAADIPLPIKKETAVVFPEVSAKSVLVTDVKSGTVLYARNPEQKLASASTTKLMTALIALNIYTLDDELTMSKECAEVESTRADLPPGEKFNIENLLNAMLVYSAGDAACLLGTGKIDSNEFLYLMNEMAYDLDMENTFFTNTIGLDGFNGAQFSSARDLYLLSRSAMKNSLIKDIVAKPRVTITSTNQQYSIDLENTNKLLETVPNSVGVKTGTTQEAGEVFIYEYVKDNIDLSIIVMGSQDRFTDTVNILNWTLENHTWQ